MLGDHVFLGEYIANTNKISGFLSKEEKRVAMLLAWCPRSVLRYLTDFVAFMKGIVFFFLLQSLISYW